MKSTKQSGLSSLEFAQREHVPVKLLRDPVRLVLLWGLFSFAWIGFSAAAAAQEDRSAPSTQQLPQSAVVTKSATAVGYEVGWGSTKVDLKGSGLMPTQGAGEGRDQIEGG